MLISLLKTFWIPIALWGFRSGTNLYRQTRATYASNKSNIRPCPSAIQRALNILFFSVLILLVTTFQPSPNVFKETSSRLQTPSDVLFTRLRSLRPLTALDEVLQEKLKSKESKLLYLAYGPEVLANCPFCIPTEPSTYLFYALPSLLAPHLIHAAVLGATTSTLLSGEQGSRWRSYMVFALLGLAASETYLTATYDILANVKATRGAELDFFHDNMNLYRSLAFIAIDCAIAGLMWTSSTGRLFVQPLGVSQRLQNLIQATETEMGRMWATSAISNAVVRDEKLQSRWSEYWATEKEVQGDSELLEEERKALGRIDTRQLSLTAEKRAEDIERILNGTLALNQPSRQR